MSYHPEKGRYLTVTNDVKPGRNGLSKWSVNTLVKNFILSRRSFAGRETVLQHPTPRILLLALSDLRTAHSGPNAVLVLLQGALLQR